ncbi:MAG: cysteine--tRNA ligase [Acidimicrobiaceae bacterium]|nr:cysteine--tRNA ligase [Acidimicrobiaceae bacterium]MCY4280257.1 cysteine--tRNA ligase [Acidimicrobiaceae bacterium]MCY4293562.1 cysteine--tRNA ligase [Acidimicrobiaceae bacterium]
MRLYDTARRCVAPFEAPSPPEPVRVYVCGITPYDSTHLGHANTYLAYDLLTRRLEDLGHTVKLVRNITDVDDSILPKARELGVDFLTLAAAETARFHRDMEALGTRPPAAEPRATQWVPQMIDLIDGLVAAGRAYTVEGTTWFDVASWPDFGRLSGSDHSTMVALAAERGGTPDDPRQRNPLDFVLWQPSAPDEPVWQSPFGPGRPGWHIECSAMAMSLLGTEIDLHGGGSDLIFPHHECEMAQSEAASSQRFVKHWMHCGMVAYEGAKMSKSLGNLVFVSDLCARSDPAAVRLALMGHHYRDDWEWHDDDIAVGETLLDTLKQAARGHGDPAGSEPARDSGPSPGSGSRPSPSADPAQYARRLRAALDDDLDAPQARSILSELADSILLGRLDKTAPALLAELCALCGISLAPHARLESTALSRQVSQ